MFERLQFFSTSCLIKDSVWTLYSCCLDGCSCLHISVFAKEIIFLLELWLASGRYNHVVRTDVLEHWNLLTLWRASGRVAMTSGRMQTWTVRSFLTLMGIRTVLPPRPDGCCWLKSFRNRQGRPDWILGSDFSELESTQNLPGTSEIAFLQLVTLVVVIIRLFLYQRNKLWISEDSEIYGIPMKVATLHNSDFVKQNGANTKTNKLSIWSFWDKNHLTDLKIHF